MRLKKKYLVTECEQLDRLKEKRKDERKVATMRMNDKKDGDCSNDNNNNGSRNDIEPLSIVISIEFWKIWEA